MKTDRLLAPATIVLAGVLAYSSAFPAVFVFDDSQNIAANSLLDDPLSFLPGGPGFRSQPNRALTFLTFALDRAVAGNSPSFHRGVNIAIHLGNALLVLALVLASFRTLRLRGSVLTAWSPAIGLSAGLLFVAHPIQTQAVSYIVQRLASLASLLYLATAVLYLRWRIARDNGNGGITTWSIYAAALALALLATKTKEIAFTLPFALLLLEAVLFEGRWWPRLAGLVPFAATLAVIPLTTLAIAAPAGATLSDVTDATRVQTAMVRGDYLLTEFTVVARYLGLVFFPVGQSIDHDVSLRHSVFDLEVIASAVLLLGVVALAVWLLAASSRHRPRRLNPAFRLVGLGIVWFFLTLSVESSVIPIVDPMFEHRVYLPFAGLSVAIATLIALGCRRFVPWRSSASAIVATAVLAAVLGGATWMRNRVWTSELALWRDAVTKAPGKTRPRHNLAVSLDQSGHHAEALILLEQVIAIDPWDPGLHESLGVALVHSGRVTEGEAHYLRAIELAPRFAGPWYGLGVVRFEAYRYAEAVPFFEKAIALGPSNQEALANLAACWNALGRPHDVVRLLRKRDDIQTNAIARAQLAIALAETGDLAGAGNEAKAVRRLAPNVAVDLEGYFQSRGLRIGTPAPQR